MRLEVPEFSGLRGASEVCRVLRHTSIDVERRKEKNKLVLCALAEGSGEHADVQSV